MGGPCQVWRELVRRSEGEEGNGMATFSGYRAKTGLS